MKNNNDAIPNYQKKESSSIPKDKRIIEKIMSRYNLTEREAEIVLKKIEARKANEKSQPKEIQNNNKNVTGNPQIKKIDNNQNQLSKKPEGDSGKEDIPQENSSEKNDDEQKKETQNDSDENQNSEVDDPIQKENEANHENVDNILSDIIPEYNKNLSIEVDHVDLTFEVELEKVDTLKESVIRTLKRKKADKIKIHAVNDISFKLYKGEKIGIIGYNGAGKSTLLNVICGIYKPDKGSVKVYGNISPLLGLGAGFDPYYTGRKNIFFNGSVLGYSKSFLKEKENEIIEFSELGDFIDIPVKNYSSGMVAKLAFSIATIVNPDILIIDEVLGVGDVNFAKKSRDKIRSLMDGGTTVLLVSHSIPQIRHMCDKAIWIDKGKIKEIGEVNKVCDNYLKDSEKATNEQLANIQLR